MKQLGILDAAFINMEHKNVPQHIGSIAIYDQSTAPGGKVRFKSLIRHFERQLKKIPMFRTRLMQAPGGFTRPYWIVDEDFDVEFHLRHIALPYPGDWRQLCIQLARLHSRPIDMSRPLWEAYVIEGLKDIDGIPQDCFVIYVKLHHSLIDGGGGNEFMAAIHDLEPIVHDDDDLPDEVYEADERPSRMQMLNTSTRNYVDNAWNLTKGGYKISQEFAKTAIKLVRGELKAPPTNAPTTRFNQPVSPYRVVESSILPLDDVKMVKDLTNTKVNDVALAVISGAMRKYLDAHGETPETSLVASLPIDMRTRTGDTGEGNQVGSIFTSLNSDIDDPLERLHAIHRCSNEAKQFGENSPARDALKLAGAMSPRLTKFLLDAYVDNKLTRHSPLKINTVISNLAGPNFPLYCCGAKMLRYHGLGVLTPGVGIFHLIFSYYGQMTITILADRAIMPDPLFYRECMDEAFEELKAAVKLDQENKLEEAKRLVSESEGQSKPSTTSKKASSSSKASSTKKSSSSATVKRAASSSSKAKSEDVTAKAEEVIKKAEEVIKTVEEQQASAATKDAKQPAEDANPKARKRAASSSKKAASSSSTAKKTAAKKDEKSEDTAKAEPVKKSASSAKKDDKAAKDDKPAEETKA